MCLVILSLVTLRFLNCLMSVYSFSTTVNINGVVDVTDGRDTDRRLFVAFWYNIISKSLGNSSDGCKKMNEDIQNTSTVNPLLSPPSQISILPLKSPSPFSGQES